MDSQRKGSLKLGGGEEVKTDAQQMTEITKGVSVSDEILEREYEPPEAAEAPKANAKAKRAPRK